MKRHRILGNGLMAIGFGMACLGLIGVTTTSACVEKVTICHRTASQTNPYVQITVDQHAVDGVAGNSGNQADHYGEHQGPIGPLEVGEWGDIIPPVPPYHNGLNWTAEGQAIWNNDCNIPTPTTEPPTTTTTTTTVAPTTTTTTTTTVAPTTSTTTTTTTLAPTTTESTTTTSVAQEGPTTTAAPTTTVAVSTTAVGGESGGLPSTGQNAGILLVSGLLLVMMGVVIKGLARRTV